MSHEGMKEFYYQIKGKDTTGYGMSQWAFPPLFSGKVEALDRKEARKKIEEEYERTFPLRVLKKDAEKEHYLLNITEIKPNGHIARLFEERLCRQCNAPFKIIDKYNTVNTGGPEYCSEECKKKDRDLEYVISAEAAGKAVAHIYKITNKVTGMCYIGKTRQVFTLRWYQHFFQPCGTKFHEAIDETSVTDWIFEVIEVVGIPEGLKNMEEVDRFISSREQEHILKFDSVESGYNSVGPSNKPQQELAL